MDLTTRLATASDVAIIYNFLCELEEETFDFELFQSILIEIFKILIVTIF